MPRPRADHGTDGRYKAGCRCTRCTAAHQEALQDYRHRKLYGDGAVMGPQVRQRIINAVLAGSSLSQAAASVALSRQRVSAARAALPEFDTQIDEALRSQEVVP